MNEKFSGKGNKIHVCKKCARLPKEKRDDITHEDEIVGYLKQSNISRLRKLTTSPNERIAELASIVLEIGLVWPRKQRRYKYLNRVRKDLIEKLESSGLIFMLHN